MSKTSDRVEAARKLVIPAAEDFVHTAADRVGPLAHSAADRVGPLAEAAGQALGVAADKVVPYAHTAVDRLTPLAQTAAERIGPVAGQARGLVTPYVQQAAERLAPLTDNAKERGVQAAHDAVDRLGPALDDAFDRVGPAVEAARGRVTDELLPKLTGALAAAAGTPLVTEVVHRGQATMAAARGELTLPPPKKKGSWVKRLGIVAAGAGVAYVLARKLLGSKDSDWQAARPTTPYSPPKPAATGNTATADDTPDEPLAQTLLDTPSDVSDEAGDDQQDGPSAHSQYLEANDEAQPDQPAEGGEAEAEADLATTESSLEDAEPVIVEDSPEETDTLASTEPEFGAGPEPELAPVPELAADAVFAEAEPESDPTVVMDVADTVETQAVSPEPDDTVIIKPVSSEPLYSQPLDSEPLYSEPLSGGSDVFGPGAEASEGEASKAAASEDESTRGEATSSEDAPTAESPRWSGEGVYTGSEPPEGFVIKGNERSMKYHLPDSPGYVRTIAEVWFSSEEAAEAAGFVRAQA